MDAHLILLIALLIGWSADRLFGDPEGMPHLIVLFGKCISFGEKKLNKGTAEAKRKKGIFLVLLIAFTFPLLTALFIDFLPPVASILFQALLIFYCLAGTTLIREVRAVFKALDESLPAGRTQVARIVGRDTSQLSDNECRTAALETLAENLSDGVLAPLFWLALLGTPGMVLYKVINTFDSMIGYRNERYLYFGRFAAKLDDIFNYLPARITAYMMLLVNRRMDLIPFVHREGRKHLSPCSGYPEAALAGLLDAQFGGAHLYFGELVEKPTIGNHPRPFTNADLQIAIRTNRRTEYLALTILIILLIL